MSRVVLSAAVDNAATAAEWDGLLEAIDRDPVLKGEWSRVWAARDAREGVAVQRAGADFCAGVMAALEQEQMEVAEHPKLVRLDQRRPVPAPARKPAGRLSWRSLVPLSAAAGVAAAVLFFGQPLSRQAEPQAVAAVAPAIQASDVAEVRWSAPERNGDASQPLNAASAEVLNGYLMEHSNTLAERSMGGAISTARFVVNTTGYSADGE